MQTKIIERVNTSCTGIPLLIIAVGNTAAGVQYPQLAVCQEMKISNAFGFVNKKNFKEIFVAKQLFQLPKTTKIKDTNYFDTCSKHLNAS